MPRPDNFGLFALESTTAGREVAGCITGAGYANDGCADEMDGPGLIIDVWPLIMLSWGEGKPEGPAMRSLRFSRSMAAFMAADGLAEVCSPTDYAQDAQQVRQSSQIQPYSRNADLMQLTLGVACRLGSDKVACRMSMILGSTERPLPLTRPFGTCAVRRGSLGWYILSRSTDDESD